MDYLSEILSIFWTYSADDLCTPGGPEQPMSCTFNLSTHSCAQARKAAQTKILRLCSSSLRTPYRSCKQPLSKHMHVDSALSLEPQAAMSFTRVTEQPDGLRYCPPPISQVTKNKARPGTPRWSLSWLPISTPSTAAWPRSGFTCTVPSALDRPLSWTGLCLRLRLPLCSALRTIS
jgi:hypothetical protein